MLLVGIPVLVGVVGALWKLRTAKTDTYTRLKNTVALGLAAFDRSAIEALVRVRSKLPVTGFDRSMGAEDFEEAVGEYNQALKDKRRLQRQFRRLLGSNSFLVIGLTVTFPSGLYLLLRGAGIEDVSDNFVYPAWAFLAIGVVLAAAGLGGLLYYEGRVAKVAMSFDDDSAEYEHDE